MIVQNNLQVCKKLHQTDNGKVIAVIIVYAIL